MINETHEKDASTVYSVSYLLYYYRAALAHKYPKKKIFTLHPLFAMFDIFDRIHLHLLCINDLPCILPQETPPKKKKSCLVCVLHFLCLMCLICIICVYCVSMMYSASYRVAWSNRMPYLHRSFSTREPYN